MSLSATATLERPAPLAEGAHAAAPTNDTPQMLWFDGELTDANCLQAALNTHALHYGSGVFEGIRSYGTENGPRIFSQATCHHAPEVYPGIGEAEASRVLKDFFQARR